MAKRIVIADDSATIQRAFAMTFGAEDVTLVAARSAEEGFATVRHRLLAPAVLMRIFLASLIVNEGRVQACVLS